MNTDKSESNLTPAQEKAYQRLDDALDGVDASVFSGELLFIESHRELLKTYIARWSKAIAEHELMQLLEGETGVSPQSVTPSLATLNPEEQALLSNFVFEVKGLCSSYSDKQNRPMMGDVKGAVDALATWMTRKYPRLFAQSSVGAFLNSIKQTCETLSKPNTPLHQDLVFKALDKVCEDFELHKGLAP